MKSRSSEFVDDSLNTLGHGLAGARASWIKLMSWILGDLGYGRTSRLVRELRESVLLFPQISAAI